MRRPLFGLLVLALSAFGSGAPAQSLSLTTWGAESWVCGGSDFAIQLGGGGAYVYGIDGDVSVAPLASAPKGSALREVLIELYADGLPGQATILLAPPISNQSVDAHLLSLILKQERRQAHNLPVHVSFAQPIYVPSGVLRLNYVIEAFLADGTVSKDPNECLDVETQLEVQWSPS